MYFKTVFSLILDWAAAIFTAMFFSIDARVWSPLARVRAWILAAVEWFTAQLLFGWEVSIIDSVKEDSANKESTKEDSTRKDSVKKISTREDFAKEDFVKDFLVLKKEWSSIIDWRINAIVNNYNMLKVEFWNKICKCLGKNLEQSSLDIPIILKPHTHVYLQILFQKFHVHYT